MITYQARWPFALRIDYAKAPASSLPVEPKAAARPAETAPTDERSTPRSPFRKLLKLGRLPSQEQIPRPKSQTDPSSVPGPQKHALLIGISYRSKTRRPHIDNELSGPHNDVMVMHKLLVGAYPRTMPSVLTHASFPETYDYDPANITVMLDDGLEPSLQPTHHNILTQIGKFAGRGSPGDDFFFQYSGHAGQVKNHNHTEEDGMDEYIVPLPPRTTTSGGEHETFIRDNVLKEILVDALPPRAQLIAIFDCCHSASLLDLPHFRCNRVVVPWINKGRRRSDSIRNRKARDNTMGAGH